MDIPGWRVEESQIRDKDVLGVQNLNKVRSSDFQFFIFKFCPPGCTLPIDGSICT